MRPADSSQPRHDGSILRHCGTFALSCGLPATHLLLNEPADNPDPFQRCTELRISPGQTRRQLRQQLTPAS